MNELKNILVCTDFSSYSDNALLASEMIRKKTHAHITLLHVSEYSVMWDWMAPDYIEGRFQLDLLNTLRKKMEEQIQGTHFVGKPVVSVGVTDAVIMKEVEERKIDLIIMGHRGQTGRFHLGSMAQKVIASSPVPVLVVKGDFHISRVGGLIDPNGKMTKILEWTKMMANLLGVQEEIVSLFPDIAARYFSMGKWRFSTELLSLTEEQKKVIKKEIREKLRDKTSVSDALVRVEVSTERKVAFHLNEILKEDHVNLVVMQKHETEFLEKILIGSETRRMLEIFEGNLLILPA